MVRPLLLGACIVVLASGCGTAPSPAPVAPTRHSLLLVTIDTLRADRLQRGFTPTLDALAARSVRFTQARTVAPLTLPAHVSLMTGMLPPAHGVRLNGQRVSSAVRTLAARVQDAGYQTAAVVGAFVLDRRFGLDAGFALYDDRIARDAAAVDRLSAERRAAVVVDAAVAWLAQVDASRPWLLWVHLYDPHAPYDPPPDATGVRPRTNEADATALAYDGEVAYVDRELARLLSAAAPAAPAIIVAGDHGESLGEHGEPTHGMLLFDGALRVPLLVYAPGVAAREEAAPVSLVDVAPTALALAGLAPHDGLTGRNLLGALDADREIYAETEYPAAAGWAPAYALVQDRWKAVASAGTTLFDLSRDPGEAANVAVERRGIVDGMRARLDVLRRGTAPQATPPVASEAAERLRALGYVTPAARVAVPSGIDAASRIDQWAAFERALSDLSRGRAAAAVAPLRALTAANAGAPLFQSTYARALTESGRVGDALTIYRDAVRTWPSDAVLYHELAIAARAAGRADEALRAEQASLVLDAAQPAAHNGLGLLLADAGRHQDAARAFAEAVALDPTSAPYRANLGNARRAIDDLAGAAEAYRQALDRDADLADAANGLGVVLVQQKRPADAIAWLERAVALDAAFVDARLNLGIAWQEAGQPARAAEHYRAVLAAKHASARERQAARALLAQVAR